MSKPLTARTHGFIDYAAGLVLLASPWMFGFNLISTSATLTMVCIAAAMLIVSACTNYQWGVIKAIPFKTHGVLETAGALALVASPWIMGFAEIAAARNVALVIGIAYLGVIALTNYNMAYFTTANETRV